MLGRLRQKYQSYRRRARIVAEAREVMMALAVLGEKDWGAEAGEPREEIQEMLMRFGLASLVGRKEGLELRLKRAWARGSGR